MEEKQQYVLFPNHDNGMRLQRELKKIGVKAVIAPTPRAASKCCGISLLVREEDIPAVEQCIKEHEIETLGIISITKDMNARRDRYC